MKKFAIVSRGQSQYGFRVDQIGKTRHGAKQFAFPINDIMTDDTVLADADCSMASLAAGHAIGMSPAPQQGREGPE
jgi:hypothetical protein